MEDIGAKTQRGADSFEGNSQPEPATYEEMVQISVQKTKVGYCQGGIDELAKGK